MAESTVWTLSWPEADIALLTLDDPNKSVNLLSPAALDGLEGHLNALESESPVGLVLRSGKPGSFVAGADVRLFAQSLDAPRDQVLALCRRGQDLFARLAHVPFVTVVAIDGLCLGGGSELAIWCDRRVMTVADHTKFGFPEVKLGLMPGWGGTARTPRIIGLSNAVELITGGEPVDARTAYQLGIAADICPVDQLQSAALALVRQEAESGRFRADREKGSASIEMSDTELAFLGATGAAYIQQQTGGHYPAPTAALEVMIEAAGEKLEVACRLEAEAFAELFGSPVNRALLHVFFLQDANKKDPGTDPVAAQPREIRSVSVIGAGVMGQGIAAANIKRGLPVAITDVSEEAVADGVGKILAEVAYNKKTKQADPDRAIRFGPLINGTSSEREIAAADLILEAVVERVDVKRQLLAKLDQQTGPETILATNTSTIPIETLAQDLQHPQRLCGIHFFNPVRRMPLVEVIRGPQTSDATLATAVAYVKRIGKSPIVVGDGPGFLVNRLLFPYMNEAVLLLTEGASLRGVDRAAKQFGMPMGPLELFDVVGLDVAVHAGRTMSEAFPDRVVQSPLLDSLVEAGRLGKKTGHGFYSYRNKRGRAEKDPEVVPLIEKHRHRQAPFDEATTLDRLFLPMLVEATRVLEEKLVRSPGDVDLGLIYGIGFPPFHGGLLFWADSLGAAEILRRLEPLESLGNRFEPTDLLRQLAQSGGKFYGAAFDSGD